MINNFQLTWGKLLFTIIFFLYLIYLINEIFPFLIINLSFFWKPYLLILVQYNLFRIYLDFKYIYPNILHFQKTHPLFLPSDDGLSKINWHRHLFNNSLKARSIAQACIYCCFMSAGLCWVGKEYFSDQKSLCQQVGDYLYKNENYKKKIDYWLPSIDKSPVNSNSPISSGPSINNDKE
jgi:hypothetical protein